MSFSYTVVIRTLGTAGEKYQRMLDSLVLQAVKPAKILVYIAEGYPLPLETIGIEEYIYVTKGMVSQRALSYDEVETEYILFLDDDVYLPPNGVETLYNGMQKMQGDVISPDVFPNHQRSTMGKLQMAISGRMFPHPNNKWAYKILRGGGYSYNNNPKNKTYLSQTNAGPCFFCKKNDFLRIHFDEELWMDKMRYALGDDEVMFYKMHCMGLKVLTIFGSGIEHLDAGSTNQNAEKEKTLVYSDLYFKTIFWHRFFYLPDKRLTRMWDLCCIVYPLVFTFLISLLKGRFDILKLKFKAVRDACIFIKSEDYSRIPRIRKIES